MINWLISNTPLLYLTQSLWRDEAFSVLLAQNSFIDIVKLSAGDFTPPLYYLLLHYWMLLFGSLEPSVRLLSFIFHIGIVVVGYKFTNEIFKEKNNIRGIIVGFMLLINPMLLYYAFEARMYSMLAFAVLLSMYMLLKKSWIGYIIATAISFYTHPYALFIIPVQALWIIWQKKWSKTAFVTSSGIAFLLFLPWFAILTLQVITNNGTWFFPVDKNLIQSILGNIYLGYEGTPFLFWKWSKRISIGILLISTLSLYYKKYQKFIVFLLLWFSIPLVIVLSLSKITPIFVNRYLIFVTVAQVMLLVHGIMNIRFATVRYLLLGVVVIGTLWFNLWFPRQNMKVAFRETFDKIHATYQKGEMIVSASPLTFFESTYYAEDRNAVYVYNPKNVILPQYIGLILIPDTQIIQQIPANTNAYLIQDNGTYVTIQNR